MAMNPDFGNARPDPATSLVARAAAALRHHTEPGWLEARNRIRSAVLSARRPTWPLALRDHPGLFVSDQVVIGLLREHIDAIDGVRAVTILITPDTDVVDLLTIEVAVAYGHPIPPALERVRRVCSAFLRDLLQPVPADDDGPRPPIDIGVVSVFEPDR